MVVAYICSVRDFAGKNVFSLGMGRKMQEDGLKLGFMKPYGVRPTRIDDEITDADVSSTGLTAADVGNLVTMGQQLKNFRDNSAVTTGDYGATMNKARTDF